MTKRYRDFEESQTDNLTDELSNKSKVLGISSWDAPTEDNSNELCERFGICGNCDQFQYTLAEYGGIPSLEMAYCARWRQIRSEKHRITQCNQHSPVNQLTLQDMKEMAFYLELSNRNVGFTRNANDKKSNQDIERQRRSKERDRVRRLGW